MSSPLTGVWHIRIEPDGKIVYLRFLESFLFLLIGSITLSFILALSFCIKYENTHKGMRVGIAICNVAMVIFDLAVLFCAFQGLINNFNWGNADFILFIFAGPLTILFIVGLLVFIYGYNEKLGLEKHI
jgi:hypothetical protein